jgi:hypothetical protein
MVAHLLPEHKALAFRRFIKPLGIPCGKNYLKSDAKRVPIIKTNVYHTGVLGKHTALYKIIQEALP